MALGHAEVQRSRGRVRFAACRAEAPLVLRPLAGHEPALLYVGQLGGGYLAGDVYTTRLHVGPAAALTVRGQASTKVYGGERPVRVDVEAHVDEDASLVLLGEPLVPYAGSSYEGHVSMRLAAGASALCWESFTAGRVACGERWQMSRLRSSIECERDGRLVLREAIDLEGSHAPDACGPLQGIASLVVSGPQFSGRLEELERRVHALPLASFTRRDDTVLVRIGVTEPGALAGARERTAEWLAGCRGDDLTIRAAGPMVRP